MEITARVLQMITKKGFISLFWEEVERATTQKEAYERLEKEYFKVFGKRRYANFNSFLRRRDEK